MTTENTTTAIDLINEIGIIQVAITTTVHDGEEVVSTKRRRYTLNPGDDLSGQPAEIASAAVAAWTPEVVAAYQAVLAPSRDVQGEIDTLERAALENRKNRETTLAAEPARMLLYLREGLLDQADAAKFTDAAVQYVLGDPTATVAGLTVEQMKSIMLATNPAYAKTKALDDQIRELRALL